MNEQPLRSIFFQSVEISVLSDHWFRIEAHARRTSWRLSCITERVEVPCRPWLWSKVFNWLIYLAGKPIHDLIFLDIDATAVGWTELFFLSADDEDLQSLIRLMQIDSFYFPEFPGFLLPFLPVPFPPLCVFLLQSLFHDLLHLTRTHQILLISCHQTSWL